MSFPLFLESLTRVHIELEILLCPESSAPDAGVQSPMLAVLSRCMKTFLH